MNLIFESNVTSIENVQPDIDVEQVLKKSKEEALSEPSFLKELDRIKCFISNVKNSKPTDLDFVDQIQAESVPFIQELFTHSQILEDTMCQYAECFVGVSDQVLSSIRVVDRQVNVPDSEGLVHVLKQGDLLISYVSGGGLAGYMVKSANYSQRYIEKYISVSDSLNYFLIGPDKTSSSSDWLFITSNFLSSLAIHAATDVMTVAVPSLDQGLLSRLADKYPDKKIMVFMDGAQNATFDVERIYFASKPLDVVEETWIAKRDSCIATLGETQGLAKFKEHLRQAMRSAL